MWCARHCACHFILNPLARLWSYFTDQETRCHQDSEPTRSHWTGLGLSIHAVRGSWNPELGTFTIVTGSERT